MNNFKDIGIKEAKILLPKSINEKWAVVACDQYTSEPGYWERVTDFVGNAPSTLNLTLPEIYLKENDVKPKQQKVSDTMDMYLSGDVFAEETEGMIYVERQVENGYRQGLIACVDLEEYDYTSNSQSMIRSTEGTIEDRLPPRVEIRMNASLELPHIMMLIDDEENNLFNSIRKSASQFDVLYEFNLMEDGGHIKGYKIAESSYSAISEELGKLKDKNNGFLFAVGDGNHSLATAKKCWENIKSTLSEEEQIDHPARYALVEICNLHDSAMVFESIHRLLINVNEKHINEIASYIGLGDTPLPYFRNGSQGMLLIDTKGKLPIAAVQKGIDRFMEDNEGVEIDYIHGDDVAFYLSNQENVVSFILPVFDKKALFKTVIEEGSLPRKSFSMGHAKDKRYYLEARKIK